MEHWATGIFTSVSGGLGAGLESVTELGVPTVHLHAPTLDFRTPARTAEIKAQFARAGVAITVVFVGFEDDDYSTVERVSESVGLVPPDRRQDRLKETLEIADFAAELGVDAIGMHLGFVSHDDPDQYSQVVEVTRTVCDHCLGHSQRFHLETGQESADELLAFIEAVGRENLAVNFDPANMILYGMGDPVAALDQLAPHVFQLHVKDALPSSNPQEWGSEEPVGAGAVDWSAFFQVLLDRGIKADLVIEREAGSQRVEDVIRARQLIEEHCKETNG